MQNNKNYKSGRKSEPVSSITKYNVTQEETLMNFLLAQLQGKSRTTVKSYLAHRQVAVNNVPVTQFDTSLKPGDVVAVDFNKSFPVFKHPRMKLLYEDDHLLVVDKGYGLLSMSTDRIKEKTAYHILSHYVKSQSPENRIFILHRLDRDTSGVMMFAKSPKLQEHMQRNWNLIVTDRRYVAVVSGCPAEEEGIISSHLAENKEFLVYSTQNPNEGRYAETHYRVLQTNGTFSLLELNLETGRKNQIRVHLKDLGHSILGDKRYGAKINPLGRLALHASVLRFTHPVTGREMCFDVGIPSKFRGITKPRTYEDD